LLFGLLLVFILRSADITDDGIDSTLFDRFLSFVCCSLPSASLSLDRIGLGERLVEVTEGGGDAGDSTLLVDVISVDDFLIELNTDFSEFGEC
jgi:hypothetical protein